MKKQLCFFLVILTVFSLFSCAKSRNVTEDNKTTQSVSVSSNSDNSDYDSPPPYHSYSFTDFKTFLTEISDPESDIRLRMKDDYDYNDYHRYADDYLTVLSRFESGEYPLLVPALKGKEIPLSYNSNAGDTPISLYSSIHSFPMTTVCGVFEYSDSIIQFGFGYSVKLSDDDSIKSFSDFIHKYYQKYPEPASEKTVTLADGKEYKITEYYHRETENTFNRAEYRFVYNGVLVEVYISNDPQKYIDDDFWNNLSFVSYSEAK